MRRLSLLFLMGCLAFADRTAIQAQSQAPYLYYYSDILNGFVIERADGTDSRVIAQGVMTSPTRDVVQDTSWSPSGKWFVWRSMREWFNLASSYDGWIIRSDGKQRLAMLDNLGGTIPKMVWSPTRDLLLVTWIGKLPTSEGLQILYRLIDPNAGTTVATIQTPADDPNWSELVWHTDELNWSGIPVWSADGQYAVVYANSRKEAQDGKVTPDHSSLMIIKADGSVTQRRYPRIVKWSPKGYLTYADSDQSLVVEQLSTGKKHKFTEITNPMDISWNPDGQSALAFAGSELYLLSMNTSRAEKLADNAVDMHWNTGLEYLPDTSQIWSPDGQTGVVPFTPTSATASTPEPDRGLLLVTPATSKVNRVKIPGKIQVWYWFSDSQHLLIVSDAGAYRYDVETNKLSSYDLKFHLVGRLSPNNRYIALVWDHNPETVDLTTGKLVRYLPHSASMHDHSGATEYSWYSDSMWLLGVENTNITLGVGDATGVMRVDGTGRRELGRCSLTTTCAGWLPARALPYLSPGSPTPVLQPPIRVLAHENSVMGLAWSPDGKQLATYTLEDRQVHLWQAYTWRETRTIGGLLDCGELVAPCYLAWSPDGKQLALADGVNRSQIVSIPDGNFTLLDTQQIGQWQPDGSYQPVQEFASPDGKYLARGTDKAEILDAASRKVLWQFERDPDRVSNAPLWFQWTPDSRRLVGYGHTFETDFELLLWNAETHQPITLGQVPHQRFMNGFTLRPDGRLLAEIGQTSIIRLWDTETGALLARLNHSGITVGFSPDGKLLASAGYRAVYLWDVSKIQAARGYPGSKTH